MNRMLRRCAAAEDAVGDVYRELAGSGTLLLEFRDAFAALGLRSAERSARLKMALAAGGELSPGAADGCLAELEEALAEGGRRVATAAGEREILGLAAGLARRLEALYRVLCGGHADQLPAGIFAALARDSARDVTFLNFLLDATGLETADEPPAVGCGDTAFDRPGRR